MLTRSHSLSSARSVLHGQHTFRCPTPPRNHRARWHRRLEEARPTQHYHPFPVTLAWTRYSAKDQVGHIRNWRGEHCGTHGVWAFLRPRTRAFLGIGDVLYMSSAAPLSFEQSPSSRNYTCCPSGRSSLLLPQPKLPLNPTTITNVIPQAQKLSSTF